MNRTRFAKMTTPELYDKAAMLLRKHDDERHSMLRAAWRNLLTEVTNEIVLREVGYIEAA